MSFPYTYNLKDEKLESLRTWYEFPNLLRLRHLQWMNTADDSQIEGLHLEIAELCSVRVSDPTEIIDRRSPFIRLSYWLRPSVGPSAWSETSAERWYCPSI